MPHPHRFLGKSALWWDLKNDVTISTPWYLGLVFRTRAKEGILLQAQAGQYTSLIFQVDTHTHPRTLPYTYGSSQDLYIRVTRVPSIVEHLKRSSGEMTQS